MRTNAYSAPRGWNYRWLCVLRRDARQVIRDRGNRISIERRQQADVTGRKAGTPPVYRVVDLPTQIFVVLARNSRHGVIRVALPGASVAGLTTPEVDSRALRDQLAAAFARRCGVIEPAHVPGNVRHGLRVRKAMPIGKILHENVPALTVSEGDELTHYNSEMLATDTGDFAVSASATLASVAIGADVEIVRTAVEVRLRTQGLEIFLGTGRHAECHPGWHPDHGAEHKSSTCTHWRTSRSGGFKATRCCPYANPD